MFISEDGSNAKNRTCSARNPPNLDSLDEKQEKKESTGMRETLDPRLIDIGREERKRKNYFHG